MDDEYGSWALEVKRVWVNGKCLTILSCFILLDYFKTWGMRWRGWLRHCATMWKIVGSIPDRLNGIFH